MDKINFTKRNIIFGAGGVVLVLLLVVGVKFWLESQRPKQVAYDPLRFNYKLSLAFHPDSVMGLEWAVADKTFTFNRKDRLSMWAPQVDPRLIQDKLNILSMIHQNTITKVGKPILQLKLQFSNKTAWEGAYDGRYFVWTSGPMQGRGADLKNAAEGLFFQEGRYAFETPKFDWCRSKVMKIDIDADKDVTLERTDKGGWEQKRFGVASSGDATRIEKWLGAHCYVAATHLVDTGLTTENKKSKPLAKMKVHFEDQSVVTFMVAPAGIISREGFDGAPAFVSAEFIKGLNALTQ